MKKVEFEFYTRPNGKNEFKIFYNDLPKKDKEKLLGVINNVSIFGLEIAKKEQWIKKLDNNLYELRSKYGSSIQRVIYFHVIRNKYIITHGFTKKTQKTPRKEINHGIALREEYFLIQEKENDKKH